MALRVLLADESSTIKKVFQLALQDFGVDVRPVNIGVDVATVARTFKPDIVFADVLLQKKNGYEVCAELKADSQLRVLPVVLMWSGFMELDEDKFQASSANAQLEKPFDVQALRKLVTQLVPRTQSQNLSQFLTFPKTPAEAENDMEMPPELAPPPKVEEEFTAVPMPKMKGGQNDKYRLNLSAEELDPNHIPVNYGLPEDEHEEETFTVRDGGKKHAAAPAPAPMPEMMESDEEEEFVSDFAPRKSAPAQAPPPPQPTAKTAPTPQPAAPAAKMAPQVPQLTAEQIENIIRKQSAEVIESVVWKVIPELAKQIIERELHRLLKERDSHP